MSTLLKDATSKTFYIGWYGECSTASDFDLTTLSADDIDNVYQYTSSNTAPEIYTPNSVFNSFTTLEKGKIYGIVLKSQSTGGTSVSIPGFISTNFVTVGSLSLTDNCDGSPNSSHSTPLLKDATSKTFYIGWYGECSTASDFDLTTLSADDIDNVYQYTSSNTAPEIYTPNSVFNSFTTLEKGKNYGIVLKSGEGSVSIPGFISTNFVTVGSLSLTDNCTPSSGGVYELYIPETYPGWVERYMTEQGHNGGDPWPLTVNLRKKDGSTLGNVGDVIYFKIEGSDANGYSTAITEEDFVGWKTSEEQQDYTPFGSNLIGYFEISSSEEFITSILLLAATDKKTEGMESFKISLVDDSEQFEIVDIEDSSKDPSITLLLSYNEYDAFGNTFTDCANQSPCINNLMTEQGKDIVIRSEFMSMDDPNYTWRIYSSGGTVPAIDRVVILRNGQDGENDISFTGVLEGTWDNSLNWDSWNLDYSRIHIYTTVDESATDQTITLEVENNETGIKKSIDILLATPPEPYAVMTSYTEDGTLSNGQELIFELTFNIPAGEDLASGSEGSITGDLPIHFGVPFKITTNLNISSSEDQYGVIDWQDLEVQYWNNISYDLRWVAYRRDTPYLPNDVPDMPIQDTNGTTISKFNPTGNNQNSLVDYFETYDDTVTVKIKIIIGSEVNLTGKTLTVELLNKDSLTAGPTSHTYTG